MRIDDRVEPAAGKRGAGGRSKKVPDSPRMADFLAFRIGAMWRFFRGEHFSFWMVCGYLFFEYVRPQSIYTWLDVLPWGQLFLLLSLVGWLLDKKKSTTWVKHPANKWMVAFLVLIILSSLMAFRPDHSWAHFIDFFGWFIIYFLLINLVNSEKRLFIFLLIFMAASFKLSLHGARVWVSRGFAFDDYGLQGPPGYFENSGELAVQMLMFFPISYRIAMSLKPWLPKLKFWAGLLMPLTAVMTVLGASSRGGQLGVIAQLYQTFLKGRMSMRTLGLAAGVLCIGYYLMPEEQLARFQNTGSDRSSRQRLLYWQGGMEMIKEHPFLGVGYFNFAAYYDEHFPEGRLYGRAQLPHNIFIQVGTDCGITGLFVFVMIIVSSFRATASIRRTLKASPTHWLYNLSLGLDAALVGFLIAGQFVTITYYPFMWINLAIAVAAYGIVQRGNYEIVAEVPAPNPVRKRGAAKR